MRVVFVAPFGLRHKTTVWARILPLAQGLRASGWESSIVLPPWDSPEDAGHTQVKDGIPLVHVSLKGGLPATVARLLAEIGRHKPDIVHIVKPRAHAGIVQWLLWQRARVRRGPLLLLDADDWEQAWARVNAYPPYTARFLAWQEEWGLRHADGITVASRWLERRVADYAPAIPRLYLPNGVELPPLAEGQGHGDLHVPPTVLYFTRYAEVSPDWLAGFVDELGRLAPGVRLLVAGAPLQMGAEQPFREAIASLHDSLITTRSSGDHRDEAGNRTLREATPALHEPALTSRKSGAEVSFLGAVPYETLPSLHAASDVAIFPARPEPLQEAKCSVRLATTLLAGVPVVASAVGEQINFGADGAARLLPPESSPAEFARAVTLLLADMNTRTRMITRAREHLAATYQWRDLAAQLAAFYSRRMESLE